MKSNIQGVIFDLDGVIVSTDDCHYHAWKRMADEEGIPFDRTVNERLRGVSRMDSLDIILEKADLHDRRPVRAPGAGKGEGLIFFAQRLIHRRRHEIADVAV